MLSKLTGIYIVLFALSFNGLAQSDSLFDSEDILEVTLRGNLKEALGDRGEDPQYHEASLRYTEDQSLVNIPIRIKTRGNFRKDASNCKYPPLFLNFSKSSTPESSVFYNQDKIKLITPCRDDQYVINEYYVYKLYNLVTPKSFKARLVKVIYEDTVKNKSSDPYFGVFLEEEEQLAARTNSIMVERLGLSPLSTQKQEFLEMSVFQYMIGNTDWSVQFMQNIKFLSPDSTTLPTTVAYDFDHAGIVRAPYAKPAPELKMSTTLQRRYRGYCLADLNELTPIFDKFNRLKDEFYAIYTNNELLAKNYSNQTIKFLDEFYETINDSEKAADAFNYPCDKSGTGNVVIKGLKKH